MSEQIFRDFERAEEVRLEAQRCGGCNQECMACPIGIDIPKMMELLKDGYFDKAGELLAEQNPFAATCGRVCSAPCSRACPKDINIKAIERWLGDQYVAPLERGKKNKRKVAVVGAGTSGLTATQEFVKRGYEVEVFEATDKAGGFMRHFVSDKAFPSKIKDRDVARIIDHVKFHPTTIVGASPRLEELTEQFDAVVIATGANSPTPLLVPGEHLHNIFTPNEFIRGAVSGTKVRTVVVGGNTVALDVARVAAKKGDAVTVVDRQSVDALHLDPGALSAAQDEGIRFMLLTQPVRFIGKKKVEAVECVQMMVTQSDFDDSLIASPIEDSNFQIPCDRVIVAVGFDPNPSIGNHHPDLRTIGKGRLWTDENGMTTMQGVFATGGIVLGSKTPAHVIAHAHKCVEKIDALLNAPADRLLKEV